MGRFAFFAMTLVCLAIGAGCPSLSPDGSTTSTETGSGSGASSEDDGGVGDAGETGSEGDSDSSGGSEGETEAAPPSGPEEIPGPTALRFPERVTIDIDSVVAGEFGALTIKGQTLSGCTGEFCDEITSATDIVHFFDEFLDHLLNDMLGDFEAERSETVTRVETTVPTGSHILAGAPLVCDFSQFDSSRSETSECSGNTAGDLVCSTCSVSGTTIFRGFFTSIPSDTDEGSGFFWFRPSIEFFEGNPPSNSFTMTVAWDHTDSALLETEICFSGGLTSGTTAEIGCGQVTQVGENEASAVKTVNFGSRFQTFDSGGSALMQGVGRWIDREAFWSGKFRIQMPTFSQENLNICAVRTTGVGVADALCDGIQTDGVDFITLPAPFTFPN